MSLKMSPKSLNGDLYHSLRKIWKEAHPYKQVKDCEDEFQKFWKATKTDRNALIAKKEELEFKKQTKGKPLINSWFKQILSTQSRATEKKEDCEIISATVSEKETTLQQNRVENVEDAGQISKKRKPVQEETEGTINTISRRISDLVSAKLAGLLTSEHGQELKRLRADLAMKQLKIRRLKTLRRAQRKHREKQRKILKSVKNSNPDKLEGLSIQSNPGRPRLEESQPELMDAIIDIVQTYVSADQRRRTETMRYVKTLDQLLAELTEMGYHISRTGLYYRLLPRDGSTTSGKRHINTVPVKLARPQNNLRKDHEDSKFAATTIRFLKDFAGLFGNETVFVLSQDDKARVPLGLPAANKQGPILMTMDYKVTLPDHDWVIATRHKLIPSVYAGLEIRDSKVSYSGPTYIAIRSGKHDSSTAFSHAIDMHRLINLDSFASFAFNTEGIVKPIWIIFVDGGPDANPRYPKTLSYAVQHFVSNKLDAMFIATNAPHQSAYNPVERRMAPLSKDLCGVILPHDYYGTHLDKSGKTIDASLEVKNFGKAGEVLARIWSQRVIDNFDVTAEYISPPGNGTDSLGGAGLDPNSQCYIKEGEPDYLTEEWKSKHVRQSNYLLQIVKCNDVSCCEHPRTNIHNVMKGQFLPPPAKFSATKSGVQLASEESDQGSLCDLSTRLALDFLVPHNTPFDKYCPSVSSTIGTKLCSVCGVYFVTKKALLAHRRIHKGASIVDSTDEYNDIFDSVLNDSVVQSNIYQITNMTMWLKQPFVELT